jgi:SMC interacting uncharacterized protein involved in chromosome segregation
MLAIVAIIMLFLFSDRPWQAVEKIGAFQSQGYNNAVETLQPQLSEMEKDLSQAQEKLHQLEAQRAEERVAAATELARQEKEQARREAEEAKATAESLRRDYALLLEREQQRHARLEQEVAQQRQALSKW